MQSFISMGVRVYADCTMSKMSDGERQRMMTARILTQDTPIILLGESTSFLNVSNHYGLVALLRKLIHDEKKYIIFSIHGLDIALSMCNSVALLDTPNLSYLTMFEMQRSRYIDRPLQNEDTRSGSLCDTVILKQ